MTPNKNHWYDGWFYDKLIAPNQHTLFSIIKYYIARNSSILDVGCGTGKLGFDLQSKCGNYTGIDLSAKNIARANLNLENIGFKNISFIHTDAKSFVEKTKEKFDYAILTYVIHEMDETDRAELLELLSETADKIIIGDYLVPRPKGFWSGINRVIEFAAGRNHYKNFKSFVEAGGLRALLMNNGFEIIKEIKNKPLTTHFVVCAKK